MLLRTCFSAFVFLAAAVVGVGQPPGDSTETDRPEELRQRLKMSRQNRVELQIRQLVQALKLDETQVEQVRGILQKEDEAIRALDPYEAVPQELSQACSSDLLQHRDNIYQNYLTLPMVF